MSGNRVVAPQALCTDMSGGGGGNALSAIVRFFGSVLGAALLAVPVAGHAQNAAKPLLQDSFRIGSGGGALCQAQSAPRDATMGGMFDRAWTLVCRDSARPVGQIHVLRKVAGESDAAAVERIAALRPDPLSCSAEGGASLPDLGAVIVRNCMAGRGGSYRVIRYARGGTLYVAQGYAAYAGAIELGLRTVVTGKPVAGKISIVSVGGDDSAAFARLQAGTLDAQTVLAEGYRRNASGNYAEAAEFFDSLTDRLARDPDTKGLTAAERANRGHEYLVNRALQLSNLGQFDQAAATFAGARAIATADSVQLRLRRNFEAMDRINQHDLSGALAILDRPLESGSALLAGEAGGVALTPEIAAELSSGASEVKALGVRQDTKLTPRERAAIIDAQAQQLRGTLLRLTGKPDAARAVLTGALTDAVAIRDGRVTSITRLRAQLLDEIALTYEAQGNFGQAEALLNQGLALLAAQYPETVALNGARARLGAFLVRRGRKDEAIALYRTIISSTVANRNALTGMANQLQPYFALLADEIPNRPALTGDLFLASQTLVRPGAADTLEILTRELSAGSSDAARLFRQSTSLTRDIERGRIALAQLTQASAQNPALKAQIPALQADIDQLSSQQADTLVALAVYPQYRALTKDVLTLDEMRAALKPGEAYLKLAQLGDALYAVWIDGAGATGYRVKASAGDVARKVAALRETISTEVGGVRTTYALDVPTARGLFLDLFGPVDARLAQASHLIFEPDGAMLQLPANLLIADQAGVDAYEKRAAAGGDEFDFRGIGWLGRSHAVSTALSARAFRDARVAAPSTAAREYIGFGENMPLSNIRQAAYVRGPVGGSSSVSSLSDCRWSPAQWNHPIPATELREAAQLVGTNGAELLTGAAFTDDAILARDNLDGFRILHFATHGLVTPPHPGCPARPALLTSFAPSATSDGLLQFSEIFGMKLNADLVILSACDTAGQASLEATRTAGIVTGGGGALDGLVRAFIGAGSRSVIASHWPAPEEFGATERLISGLFQATPGEAVGEALRAAQIKLMDDPETSHPFYWSGFAIIGDGARPLIAQR